MQALEHEGDSCGNRRRRVVAAGEHLDGTGEGRDPRQLVGELGRRDVLADVDRPRPRRTPAVTARVSSAGTRSRYTASTAARTRLSKIAPWAPSSSVSISILPLLLAVIADRSSTRATADVSPGLQAPAQGVGDDDLEIGDREAHAHPAALVDVGSSPGRAWLTVAIDLAQVVGDVDVDVRAVTVIVGEAARLAAP